MSRAKMPTDCRPNSKIYFSPLSTVHTTQQYPTATYLPLKDMISLLEHTFLEDTELESHSSHIGLGRCRSKPQSKAGQVSRAIKTPL